MSDDIQSEAEQAILDGVADTHGEMWASDNAEMILAQARLVGEL